MTARFIWEPHIGVSMSSAPPKYDIEGRAEPSDDRIPPEEEVTAWENGDVLYTGESEEQYIKANRGSLVSLESMR